MSYRLEYHNEDGRLCCGNDSGDTTALCAKCKKRHAAAVAAGRTKMVGDKAFVVAEANRKPLLDSGKHAYPRAQYLRSADDRRPQPDAPDGYKLAVAKRTASQTPKPESTFDENDPLAAYRPALAARAAKAESRAAASRR